MMLHKGILPRVIYSWVPIWNLYSDMDCNMHVYHMHVYPCHSAYMALVTRFCTVIIVGMFVYCRFR